MYHEEMKMPLKWTMLFVQPVILVIIALGILMAVHPFSTTTRLIMIAIIVVEALFTAGIIALFTQLSVTIADRVLTVGFRVFRERIPLEKVAACAPLTYRWTEWGGYGIRVNKRGKMYNVPGDGGRAVQVTLDNGRRVCFSSANPDNACAAIQDARGSKR